MLEVELPVLVRDATLDALDSSESEPRGLVVAGADADALALKLLEDETDCDAFDEIETDGQLVAEN
jgi:hypothetical protein